MTEAGEHRARLIELLELAQTYRGWNRRELAKTLGRDPSKLVPDSGMPKLDLVVGLAGALDWPVEDVVEALCGEQLPGEEDEAKPSKSFAQLDAAAVEAHRNGRYPQLVRFARSAQDVASTPDEFAIACNREAGGWDGQGRFRNALQALQRGLQATDASIDYQLMLRANLANAYYTLWQLFEAKGIARELVDLLSDRPPESRYSRMAMAFAQYVLGNCLRRLIVPDRPETSVIASEAIEYLQRSSDSYLEISQEKANPSHEAVAHTCRGGIMEAEAAAGRRPVSEVLGEYIASLQKFADPSKYPVGDWLESYGWWCVFGCNVALRHTREPALLDRSMAVLTNKADEIAELLGNWSMRERVFALEFARRRRRPHGSQEEEVWTIDSEDIRRIAGTMGRFPSFHRTGWEILRTANIARGN